jgi:hypothetical protein
VRSKFERCLRHVQAALLAAGVVNAGCGDDQATSIGPMTTVAGSSAPSVAGSGSAGTGGAPSAAGSGGANTAGAPSTAGSSGSIAAGDEDAGAQPGAATGKLSFANDIFPRVIRNKCSACHNDAPSFGGLALFPGPEMAYGNLVGVPSGTEEDFKCKGSGLMRVQPGDPEKSLMYLKLINPPCGSRMPPAAFGQATEEQVNLVRQWILDGAAP